MKCHTLTCHDTVPAVCLVYGPGDGLINTKHVASASEGEYKLCLDWKT